MRPKNKTAIITGGEQVLGRHLPFYSLKKALML